MKIKTVEIKEEMQQAMNIRYKVFCDEQGVPVENEKDEYDENAVHFLGFIDNRPVAVSRYYVDDYTAVLGRVAVLKEYRGRKIAHTLCMHMIGYIKNLGIRKITLHSQTYITGLYKKLGFKEIGEEFMEEGIPHIQMNLQI